MILKFFSCCVTPRKVYDCRTSLSPEIVYEFSTLPWPLSKSQEIQNPLMFLKPVFHDAKYKFNFRIICSHPYGIRGVLNPFSYGGRELWLYEFHLSPQAKIYVTEKLSYKRSEKMRKNSDVILTSSKMGNTFWSKASSEMFDLSFCSS